MIFYFSGTGNSLHVARVVSEAQGERLVSIAEEVARAGNTFDYALAENELLGFVYPIYAWAPPRIVLDFVKRMKVRGGADYVFAISTCGSEEGDSARLLGKALARKGLKLDSAFSLQMPNSYIIGYDVDSEESERGALRAADERLKPINAALSRRESGVYQLIKGRSPRLKTALINRLFSRFALRTDRFYATDACTRCGLCESICPVHTISLAEKPVWGKACTQCLACINRCPAHAIQYGKDTLKRGRYVHPDLRQIG
jgi:ferredoxin